LGCCVFGAGLLAWFLRPGVVASFVLILVFALGNRLMVNRADLYAATDACKIEPAVYTAIVESASWLAEFDPTFSRVRTWFDEGERIQPAPACTVRVGAVGSAITAMAYVPYVTNPFPMPGVDDVPEAALQALARDGAILMIITNAPDHLQRWGRRLDGLRLAHEEVARHDTRILGSEFAIHAWQIAAAAPHVSGFEPPIISITPRTPPEINVYGTPKGRIVTDGDRVRFVPTDARDHVAYPFVPLSLAADSWARVVVEAQPSVSRSCHVIVQATDLVVLATLGCGAGTAVVPVPRKTQGIRLYLTDATRTAFELPAKIDVSLAQPPF
jgi:hypothetical protein